MDMDQIVREVEDMLKEMEGDKDVNLARRAKHKTQDEGTSSGKKRVPKKSRKEPKEKEFIPRSAKVATTMNPGETLDLMEVAKYKEVFVKAYGPLYVLELDFIVRIHLQQLKRGQSHQVVTPPYILSILHSCSKECYMNLTLSLGFSMLHVSMIHN